MSDHEQLKLGNQLCFPLYAAARQVVNLYNPFLGPLGLTYTEYLVFLVLWEKDRLSVGELGKRLYLNNSTLTPLLKRMEKNGYLTRSRSEKDERIVELRLTDRGRDMEERCADIPAKVAGCVDLPQEKAILLYSLLYEILEGADKKKA